MPFQELLGDHFRVSVEKKPGMGSFWSRFGDHFGVDVILGVYAKQT